MDVDQERDEEGPEIRAKLAQYVDAVALPECPYKTSDFRERVTAETVSKKTGKPYMKNVKKPFHRKIICIGPLSADSACTNTFFSVMDKLRTSPNLHVTEITTSRLRLSKSLAAQKAARKEYRQRYNQEHPPKPLDEATLAEKKKKKAEYNSKPEVRDRKRRQQMLKTEVFKKLVAENPDLIKRLKDGKVEDLSRVKLVMKHSHSH